MAAKRAQVDRYGNPITVVHVRITRAEEVEIEQAAGQESLPKSTFVRRAALAHARQVLGA